MAKNSDNRRRVFADAVAIDAWHDKFSGSPPKADLHADVVFGTARVGGEAGSPVRFRLSVKQAEVVIVIPELEPVDVDRKSVSRDAPNITARIAETHERKVQAHVKAEADTSLSPTRITAEAAAEFGAAGSVASKQTVRLTEEVQMIIVTQSKTAEGHYRWLLTPGIGPVLQGRPWDAESNPRLKIIDKRSDPKKGIPPTVRVEVRCRREDLTIEGLEIKDETAWQRIQARSGFKNRMAAAISYIRDQLAQEGLEVNNIEDIFGSLTLGSTTAGPN